MVTDYHLSGITSTIITNMKQDVSSRGLAFGNWLASEIRLRGLNQAEFAQKVGATPTTVSRWVNGRVPAGRFIERIADVLVLDYDLVATKAGYRPRELLEIDPDSPTARLEPLIEAVDWSARPERLASLEFELRQMIEWDRMRKEGEEGEE